MNNPQAVEAYLLEHIPLSKAMSVSVKSLDKDRVILTAPLTPNINHRGTAFGGSISTLATLAAWTFVHVKLRSQSLDCRIVIQSHQIDYLKPIAGDFEAHCFAPVQKDWARFCRMIDKRGKGRIPLCAEVYGDAGVSAQFRGEFVAFLMEKPHLE